MAQAMVLIVVAVGGVAGVLILVRAWARRLSHPPSDGGEALADVAEMRDAVQHLTGRVGELEERLDFAERLLARDRDAERLKGPKA
jgi:hypothetical protein